MFGPGEQPQNDNIAKVSTGVCYRSRDEAAAELEREANVRFKCFDKWVAVGKLSQVDAQDRIERLISAWHYLRDTDEARAKAALDLKAAAQKELAEENE